VVDAERRGEVLAAADLAERGLEEHPDDVALRYHSVLALARAGSTAQAASRFAAYGLGDLDDGEVQALGARIAKDVALGAHGDERRRVALESAERYAEIFACTGAYYPGVNAATMHLVAGRPRASRTIARRVLDALNIQSDELGDPSEVEVRMARAMTLAQSSLSPVAVLLTRSLMWEEPAP